MVWALILTVILAGVIIAGMHEYVAEMTKKNSALRDELVSQKSSVSHQKQIREATETENKHLRDQLASSENCIQELGLQIKALEAEKASLRRTVDDCDESKHELYNELGGVYKSLDTMTAERDRWKRDAETARIVVAQKIEQLSKAASDHFETKTELERLQLAIKENAIAPRKKTWKQFVSEVLP